MKPVSLSGADYFHLLIDRKIQRFGLAGNISRVHLQLDQATDLQAICENLESNAYLQEASNINYKLRWPLPPKWVKVKNRKPCIIFSSELSKQAFNQQILNQTVNNKKGLVCIDLCTLTDGSKHLVVSMHHALFDHQGMMNFVAALNNTYEGELFATSNTNHRVLTKAASAFKMTLYMLTRGSAKLGSLLRSNRAIAAVPNYQILTFSKEQSKQIEQNAWQAGSRIGTSAFLISATAKSVDKTLTQRGIKPAYLWFSTPHKQRKIGAQKSLFSNQLSFLFFKLDTTALATTNNAVNALNNQLRDQIKNRVVERYGHLMDALKLVPLFVYEQMVDVASKGKLASFGFSDLGQDQLDLTAFCGVGVEQVFRYPPIPTPPGFNVAVVKTNEQFQFVFGYVDAAMNQQEMTAFLTDFKHQLLSPI